MASNSVRIFANFGSSKFNIYFLQPLTETHLTLKRTKIVVSNPVRSQCRKKYWVIT